MLERENKVQRQSGWVKGLRRIGGGDQADIFNLTQNNQNTVVHLKVEKDQ